MNCSTQIASIRDSSVFFRLFFFAGEEQQDALAFNCKCLWKDVLGLPAGSLKCDELMGSQKKCLGLTSQSSIKVNIRRGLAFSGFP